MVKYSILQRLLYFNILWRSWGSGRTIPEIQRVVLAVHLSLAWYLCVLAGSPAPGQRDPEGSLVKKLRHRLHRIPEQSSVFTAQLHLPTAWISLATLCWALGTSALILHNPPASPVLPSASHCCCWNMASLLWFSLSLFSRAQLWELCWLPRKWASGEQKSVTVWKFSPISPVSPVIFPNLVLPLKRKTQATPFPLWRARQKTQRMSWHENKLLETAMR